MYKNASYKEKFADLKEWIPFMMESIKKDLRNEHLKKDVYFVKKFLSSRDIHKISNEELSEAYQKAIHEDERGEEIAEFVSSRWLIKHGEVYEFFEKQLTAIDPNFSSLEEIKPEVASEIINNSIKEFGAPQTYLFSVLNSVVFPKENFDKLRAEAKHRHAEQQEESMEANEKLTLEQSQKKFERELARLSDKYEKKLSGLQKKYVTDVDALKKQIAQLQRKLQDKK